MASSPTGGGAFRTFSKEVDRQVELEAGCAHTHRSGINFGAGLFGEFGDLNSYGANVSVSTEITPFGGVKQSGLGKEGDRQGV